MIGEINLCDRRIAPPATPQTICNLTMIMTMILMILVMIMIMMIMMIMIMIIILNLKTLNNNIVWNLQNGNLAFLHSSPTFSQVALTKYHRALFVCYISLVTERYLLVRQKVGFSRKILASNCADCGNMAIVVIVQLS